MRFQNFTFDEGTHELRRHGELVKLKPQPALVLALLVRSAGQLVTRDAIKAALWPDDTFVDFDLGINSCIRQIRIALGDDADSPRYIQTHPKRGYRFLPNPDADADADASEPMTSRSSPWRRTFAAIAIVVSGLGLLVFRRADAPDSQRVVRTSVSLPAGRELLPTNVALALSPDGTRLVYKGGEGSSGLYLRELSGEAFTPVPGSEHGFSPFFSPHGDWIGFRSGEHLMKAHADGTGASVITEVGTMRGADWAPDGTIVYSQDSGLMKVSANGGTPDVLTRVDADAGERFHYFPELLPSGKGVLFTIVSGAMVYESSIVVKSFDTGDLRVLAKGSAARYAPSGHLIYAREATLYAIAFDLERLEVSGTGVPVATNVSMSPINGSAQFAISDTGTLVYATEPRSERRLVLVDLQGRVTPLAAPPRPYLAARFSPDGRSLAVSSSTPRGGSEIHTYELAQERFSLVASRLQGPTGESLAPWFGGIAWHPDGRRLVIDATPSEGYVNLFLIPIDGSEPVKRLTESAYGARFPANWSADGERLLYHDFARGRTNSWDIYELRVSDGSTRALLDRDEGQGRAELLRNGRFIAYDSTASGRSEVYVAPYGQAPGKQASVNGGRGPLWAPDGRTLYFRDGDRMMAVELAFVPELTISAPRRLFERPDFSRIAGSGLRTYDLAPDGSQFVMIQGEDEPGPSELAIVLNWTSELARLVPRE